MSWRGARGLFVLAALWWGALPSTVGATGIVDVTFGEDLVQPAPIIARDVARTVKLGSRVLWVFGDTLTTVPEGVPSSTAVWAPAASPTALEDTFDDRGVPWQGIAQEPDEIAAGQRTYSVGVIANPDRTASVFYEVASLHAPLHFESGAPTYQGFEFHRIGVATFAVDSAIGVRSPAFLPTIPPDLLATGAVRRGSSTYLFLQRVSDAEPDHPVFVARLRQDIRAPMVRYWSGSAWVADFADASPVARLPSLWGFAVSYNRYLHRYLYTYGAHDWTARLRTSISPTRGWSDDVIVAQLPPGSYAAFHQPDLLPDPSMLFITYFSPVQWIIGRIGTLTARLVR